MDTKQHVAKQPVDKNRESKTNLEQIKIKSQHFKIYGMQQNQFEEKNSQVTGLLHEMRNIPNEQLNYTPKGTRKKKSK